MKRTSLQYELEGTDTPITRERWERMLPPQERILFPPTLEALRDDWWNAINERRMTPQELSNLSGLPEDDVIRAIKGRYATIEEAENISEALGFSLKRYPTELRRSR